MATVVFDRVTKKFDDVTAVDNLSLKIEDGEFLVLVGPSGCGKSTALRCLAGLEEVTDGQLIIGDRVVNNIPPKNRDIAMVFQNYALYPHMDVRENMSFGLRMRRMDKAEIERRIVEAAEILGISELLERKPKQLSGGQRQRVALGRAIVREPLAFLMDEPLSNLDAKLRVQTRAEIIRIQKRVGVTTIYVTHDQVEAMTMGDRIAVMNHGVLQQLDTPQNIFDSPVNLFVATFIGSPAMDVFQADATVVDGGVRLAAEDIALTVPAEHAAHLKEATGRKVYVGIRPEHLTIRSNGDAAPSGSTFKMPVELVETLGSERLVHARGPEGKLLVARVESDVQVQQGEVVEFIVDMARLHVFDGETEVALT